MTLVADDLHDDGHEVYEMCETCEGSGEVVFNASIDAPPGSPVYIDTCPDCGGDGMVPHDCEFCP